MEQTYSDSGDRTEYKDLDPDYSISNVESIQEAYTDEELNELTIVRDEKLRRFMVYGNDFDLFNSLMRNEQQTQHEVILAGRWQKLRWDIDLGKEKISEIASHAGMSPILDAIMCAADDPRRLDLLALPDIPSSVRSYLMSCVNESAIGYNQYRTPNNDVNVLGECLARSMLEHLWQAFPWAYILRCNSYVVGADNYKFSIHLIVGVYAVNCFQLAEHASRLYSTFKSKSAFHEFVSQFIDMGVYKSIQNFRLTGSIKLGTNENRRKVLVNNLWDDEYENWRHTLITHIDGKTDIQLDEMKLMKSFKSTFEEIEMLDKNFLPDNFTTIIAEWSEGLEPRRKYGNVIFFDRLEPSYCKICKRTHDNENSLIVIITESSYIVKCRRDAKNFKIYIPIVAKIGKKKITNAITATLETTGRNVICDQLGNPIAIEGRYDSKKE